MTTYRRSLVGLVAFALVAVSLTALLVRTVQGFQDGGYPTYRADFTNAAKVLPGDDVRLAGVDVGRVKAVELTPRNLARVTFSLDPTVHLRTSTTMAVRYRNLIGDRYLALTVPDTGPKLHAGAVIPVGRTSPALDLTAVFNGFRPLLQGLDGRTINSLSYALIRALQGEGGTLASLLSNTGALGQTVARNDAVIGRVVADLSVVLRTLNRRSVAFNRLVSHVRTFTAGLARDRRTTVNALASIDAFARATDTMLSQARPHLHASIRSVHAAADNLYRGRRVLAAKLHLLPIKLNAIMRSAQYGSWFQFYNCGLGTQVDLAGRRPPLVVPPHGPGTGVCGG